MKRDGIVAWLRTEFQPLTLATPEPTLEQLVDSAIRYWNTHSGYKIFEMYDLGNLTAENEVVGTGDGATLAFGAQLAGNVVLGQTLQITATSGNTYIKATDDGFGYIFANSTAVIGENVAVGDGVNPTFNFIMVNIPCTPRTFSITDGVEVFTDHNGVFTGSLGGTGTINYATGAVSITFHAAPLKGAQLLANYSWCQMYGTIVYNVATLTLLFNAAFPPNIGSNIIANYNFTVGGGTPLGITGATSTTGAFIPIKSQFKHVAQVYPSTDTTWIWKDHPLWTLLGLTIMDNMTADLVQLSATFQMYRLYVGTDFRWSFVKSDDSKSMGKLMMVNLPYQVTKICVVGAKRVLEDEDIKSDHIIDWLLNYSKSLLKIIEGNTLRKSSIINVNNDGDTLVSEGKEEKKALEDKLAAEGRWLAMCGRF